MRMHPLLMGGASLGLPRSGLVALWDPYRDAYGLTEEARLALQTGQDYSGHSNTLTYGATTGASTDDPANTGTAWSFDGGDYLGAGRPATLEAWTGGIVWGFVEKHTGTSNGIFRKGTGAGSRGPQLTTGANHTFEMASDASTLVSLPTSGKTYNDGNYRHTLVRYIPSASIDIFVGGVNVATKTSGIPSAQYLASAVPLQIGGMASYAYLTGEIAYFYIILHNNFSDLLVARTSNYVGSLMARRGVTLA